MRRGTETPSWDQWFLRDAIWPTIRPLTLVHDRCFHPAGALPFPGDVPDDGGHVGQNEWAARRGEQLVALMPFLVRVPSLKL